MTQQIKREEPTEGKLMHLPICWDWDVGQTAEVHILQILKQTWPPDSPYLASPALYPELSSSRAGLPLPQRLFHIYSRQFNLSPLLPSLPHWTRVLSLSVHLSCLLPRGNFSGLIPWDQWTQFPNKPDSNPSWIGSSHRWRTNSSLLT